MENWKTYPLNENYLVSDMGKIKSLNYLGNKGTVGILKGCVNGRGYIQYRIKIGNVYKWKKGHQIVYETFVSKNLEKGFVIDHIDSDKTNNTLNNLRAISFRENMSKERTKKRNLPTGVYKNKNGKLYVLANLKNKLVYLGSFENQIDASNAYKKATK